MRVIDFMPLRGDGPPRLMRIVEGLRGQVPMRMEFLAAAGLRVDLAVGRAGRGRRVATARARRVPAQHAVPLHVRGRRRSSAEFEIVEGTRERFALIWHPLPRDGAAGRGRRLGARPDGGVVARVERRGAPTSGAYRDEVLTSLIALKAMTVRGDRRDRRGADDVAAGGPRRRAQLGLPLLLAARLGAGARGAARGRLHRRGARPSATSAARRARATRRRSRSCTGSAASGA